VRIAVDAYPGKIFEGKITAIEPQIAADTRNIRVQATLANPDHILKPGMFATTTVVLPDKPAVVTVPETAVDYTLYGDSVFLITEKKKEDDGKSSLTVVRTFVRTGKRVNGRAEIISGLKPGDRVVAVGQLKLAIRSGSDNLQRAAAADSGPSTALLRHGPKVRAWTRIEMRSRSLDRIAIERSASRWSGPISSSSGRCWRLSSAC